jgi:hypothetical protein
MGLKDVWHSGPCRCAKWLAIIIGVAVFGSWFANSALLSWMPAWLPLKDTAIFAAPSVLQIEAERLLIDSSKDSREDRLTQYKRQAVVTAGYGLGEVFCSSLRLSSQYFQIGLSVVQRIPQNLVCFLSGEYFTQWWYRKKNDSEAVHKKLSRDGTLVRSQAFGAVETVSMFTTAPSWSVSGWNFDPVTFLTLLGLPLIQWTYEKVCGTPDPLEAVRASNPKERPQEPVQEVRPSTTVSKPAPEREKSKPNRTEKSGHWKWICGIGIAVPVLVLVLIIVFFLCAGKGEDKNENQEQDENQYDECANQL